MDRWLAEAALAAAVSMAVAAGPPASPRPPASPDPHGPHGPLVEAPACPGPPAAAARRGAARGAPRADELEELRRDLRSGDKWVRRDAVEGLVDAVAPGPGAAAASPKRLAEELWLLVLGALADPAGEVADAAQWLVGERGGPELLEPLGGRDGLRSRDPWVRRRVAELLGRLPADVPARTLLVALDDDDPEVRRLAAWSLERRARAGRLPDGGQVVGPLARLAGGAAAPELRARALHALAAVDPLAAARPVRAALEDRAPAVRCAATALALAVLGSTEGEQRVLERAADPSLAVRTRAVESLVAAGSRSASAALARRLAEEREERLSWRIVERLQQLSGRRHRRDPRPWLDWAAALPEGWRPEPSAGDGEGARQGERTTSLASLVVLSHRVGFLIDLSGSIWLERDDGRTRKEVVDGELAAVLRALPEAARFNLLPYATEPEPWQERLVPATRRNVDAAVRWFEECDARGSGNLWDAFLVALADPDVDTLVVLTDGVPTGGRHNRLELLVPLLLERNASLELAVDVVLVDAPRRVREPWRRLARETGGRTLEVSLR